MGDEQMLPERRERAGQPVSSEGGRLEGGVMEWNGTEGGSGRLGE